MSFRFTPAERNALAALYQAQGQGRAAPIKYVPFPRLLELGLIQRGPNGFAYVTSAGDVDVVEAGIETMRRQSAATANEPGTTEADRQAAIDRLPKRMQEAIRRARHGGIG